ncbi:MAG: Mfa1 family fimbria major subunit [Prevotella sp.]|uniref:Mfa1 family fimbria major subunit n=1 Tax=Prevotella sp. TaxID=59823 RepID=UPI0025D82D4C|nr:Mfa1 family fimbria major subunit [Prevotella sp.]MCI7118450.1 Mfa1 family fimbria major subunit [Prevotella sp.]
MKIFKLFPLACAALMMSACSSDDAGNEGGNPGAAGDPQYLAVNIVNVGTTPTRANDYEDGKPEENKISKVRFYFFNGDGSPYLIKATGTEVTGGENKNWLEATPGDDTTTPGSSNVEKITQAVLVIDGVQNAAPSAIVAVVNPETVDATTLKNGGTMRLSELRNTAVGQNFYKKDASTGAVSDFVMSNSVYVNTGEDVCASLVAGHVATSAETAKAKPVELYVERVVAKVTANVDETAFKLGDGTDWDATKYGTKTAVGKIGDNEVYAVIDGWGLASENGKAEIEKKVDKTWSDGNLGFSPWTTSDYHRCFWEQSVAFDAGIGGNQPVNHRYSDLKAKMNEVLYTLPNTPANKVTDLQNNDLTKLAVAATLKYKDAAGNWHDADICRYNGVQFLGVDNLKKQVALTFSQYYTSTDAHTYTQLSASDIDFKDPDGTMQQYRVTPTLAADPAGTKKYYTKTTSGSTPTFTEVPKSTVLAAIEAAKAEIRKGGKAYYYVPIKHLGNTGEVAEYGIVRNHFYKITLSGIKGFGTPVYNPDQVVKPVVPTYDDTYLAARVQVLQWRIVNQSANLGE